MVACIESFRRTAAQAISYERSRTAQVLRFPKLNRVGPICDEIFLCLPKRKPPVLQ